VTHKTFTIGAVLVIALVGTLATACSSTSSPGSSGPVIQKAATASGDAQTATVATVLPNPLRVLVTVGGTPKQGDTVTWVAVGAVANITSPGITDASGTATATWTLGQAAGTQTATATLSGASGSPVTFTATATPGPATAFSRVSGDAQQAVIGTSLKNPVVVKAADQYGNGRSGVTVNWQATTGGGTVMPPSDTTDASGNAQATLTLDGMASNSVTATSSTLTPPNVVFHETGLPIPTTAAVTVGPGISFKSARNSTSNPAVDTIAVNGTVTWTWAAGSISHSVQSTGSPSFTSSATQTSGSYSFTFTATGTYQYDCVVHGTGMTGTIVVR